MVAPRSAFASLALLGAVHLRHRHGVAVDDAGIALAAAASWFGIPGIGEPVLIVAGVYAARGRLDIAEVLVFATLGAAAGGSVGWLLGRRGGRALWAAPGPLQRLRLATLARGERFFERYGLLALYVMPSWVAGVNAVPAVRFLTANAAFAVGWALLVGGGSYLIGPSIEDVVSDLGLIGVLALVALIVGGFAAERLRRLRARRRGTPV